MTKYQRNSDGGIVAVPGTTFSTGSYEDWVKRTQECAHANGWDYIENQRERCHDCGLVRVNETRGRF